MTPLTFNSIRALTLPFATGATAALVTLLGPSGRNLEYEHVTAAAALVTVVWPLTKIWFPGALRPGHAQTPGGHPGTGWLATAIALFAGLAMPGTVMFLFRMCPCSSSGYGKWLLLQALPSCLLAGATSAWLDRASRASSAWPPRPSRTILTAGWILIVLAALTFLSATVWFFPQKRIVHAFFGFLHGPVYDERIWIHADVIRARLAHAAIFCGLGIAAGITRGSMRIIVALAIGVTGALFTLYSWNLPATGHGHRVLQKQFPHVIEGEGFRLFHHDAPQLSIEAAFHIRDLKSILGDIPYPEIDIYAYPDARTKKILFGGGATDVTDVWTPGIHITASALPGPHPTLRHELVHALTSRIAFHGLGFHPNMAITEGLAVALAPDENIFNVMSLDEAASELIDSGRVPNPESLFSPWTFWLESGPRSYTIAGSLIGWMIRARGIGPVLGLYAGKNWHSATGNDAATVLPAWQDEISKQASGQRNATARRVRATTLFRSGGVAMDACPHSFADRMAADPDVASLEYMATHTGDPSYTIMARRREARDLFDRKDKSAARDLAEKLAAGAAWPPRHEEDIELRILAIDLAAFSGHDVTIVPGLAELTVFHASHPLPVHLARQMLVRERLSQIVSADKVAPWRWYLAGWAAIPAPENQKPPKTRAATDSAWLLDYLRVRNWLRAGIRPSADTQLSGFADKNIDPVMLAREPDFAFEWYRSLAELFEREHDAEQAHGLWLKAAAVAGNATVRDRMEQNARRALFSPVP